MHSSQSVTSLFKKDKPDEYISPDSLGAKCAYEIRKGQMMAIGALRIAGYRMSQINTVDKLYELIHPQDLKFVVDYSISSINYMNDRGINILAHQSKIIFRARGRGGKLHYIQRHAIANGQSGDMLSSNFSFIEDMTWMRPTPGTWQLMGPNTEGFDFEVPEVIFFAEKLSPRELEILRLIAKGFQSRDISNLLKISPHTVTTHRRNMLKKVEVSNTPELITLARDMGLI